MKNLDIGDVVFVRDAGKGLIAYDPFGKVILPTNKRGLSEGYYKVSRIDLEAERFYKAELVRVVYDLHHSISKDELMEVCTLHGYTLGYIEPFKSNHGDYIEHQYLFYNPNNGNLLTCETFDDNTRWNSFNVYIHCNGHDLFRNAYFSRGGSDSVCLSLIHNGQLFYNNGILNLANSVASRGHGKVWGKGSHFGLWHYGEAHDDRDICEISKEASARLKRCPSDIWDILGEVEELRYLH